MQQNPQSQNQNAPDAGQNYRYAPDQGVRRLRVSDLLFAIRKRLVLILICTAVGLVLGIILGFVSYLRGEMSKQYLITTSIAVTSQNANGMFTSDSKNPGSTDIHLAEDMVDAVIYVIRSDRTLNAAVERLNLIGVSTKDIYNNLRVTQYNETQIIELSLYWRSAQEGISILTAINQVVPDILISTLKIGSASVINEPRSRYIIGGSLNASMWVFAAMMGAMLGAGFAVLELLLRPTLLSSRDVQDQLGLELLGEIPERKAFFRKKRNLLFWADEEDSDPVVLDNYVAIAHIIQRQLKGIDNACVYLTSASQNEGKTTVAAYLAVMLSGLGTRVLLLDLDTRNPRLGGLFINKVDYSHSLNALYRGDIELEDAVTHLTGTLDILPTVLESKPIAIDEAMCGLISSLKAHYDVVLIDTAPVGQVAETMSLGQIVDTVLFVARFDGASIGQLREALYRIEKSGRPIMGCLFNGVKSLRAGVRSGYGYGYGYGSYHKSAPARKRPRSRKSELEREWEEWERKSDDSLLQTARSELQSYEPAAGQEAGTDVAGQETAPGADVAGQDNVPVADAPAAEPQTDAQEKAGDTLSEER
ncbi:MAG: AAA family ATPase [Candidatus Fimadaptatus sp.]